MGLERDGGTRSSRQTEPCLEAGWEVAATRSTLVPVMLCLNSPPARCPITQRDVSKQGRRYCAHFTEQNPEAWGGEQCSQVKPGWELRLLAPCPFSQLPEPGQYAGRSLGLQSGKATRGVLAEVK